MEPQQIAATLTAAVAPFLPYLKIGTEELSKKVGEHLGEKFQGLWRQIFASKPVEQAVAKVAENPEDNEAITALAAQLETLMQYHVDLASELEAWAQERVAGPTINATQGDVVIQGNNNKVATNGSIIVGGDLSGGIRIGRGRD